MYSEKVMDHFNNPRNVGELENPSGVGTVGNAKCGDIMRIYLDIDNLGVIQDAKFKTFGCGAAVATSSMATELVKGKTVQEALTVTNKTVMEALDGLPPVKVHLCLPRRRFTPHCGITQKSTASKLPDSNRLWQTLMSGKSYCSDVHQSSGNHAPKCSPFSILCAKSVIIHTSIACMTIKTDIGCEL